MMEYLHHLLVYLSFAFTCFIAVLLFVGDRAYKKRRKALYIALYCVITTALCAALAALYDIQNEYIKTDGLSYAVLCAAMLAYICVALDMPAVKKFHVLVSGIVLRHAYSRIANCILHYIPSIDLFWGTVVKTSVAVALFVPTWFLFRKSLSGDDDYVPNIKQAVALFVVCMIVMYAAYLEPIMRNYSVMAYVLFTVLEITVCFAALGFQMLMYNHAKNAVRMQYERELAAERVKQYENFQSVIDTMNVKYHDLKHQIRSLSDGGKAVDAGVIDGIERTLSDYGAFVSTGNASLDTVLTEKSMICEANKISFSCKIDGAKLAFIPAVDIRAFFGNALDNAIEYLRTVDDAGKRYVHVNLTSTEYFIKISVENYFDGKAEFGKNGLPVSRKDDGTYHGFGTKSIAEIAERHGGAATFKAENNTFKLDAIFPIVQ